MVITSDATSLSLMDLNSDHQPDLLVASNNQPLQTFINQGRGATSLLVKVKGKAGNLRGAGSRLQVIRKNGISEVIDLNRSWLPHR